MYGMGLQKAGKSNYTVKNLHQYDKYIADPLMLPDVLVPYKPTITAFDENSLKNVIPDTIAYKTNAAGKKLTILVYKSNMEKAPVVFHIHGGGWVSGSNKGLAQFCKTLAGLYGITVVSVQYTFATVPGTKMGDTVQDCYDAVNYVLDRADEFNINPELLGFFGSSAGGQLSACCALHFPQTKAYVGWYGAYDLIYTMKIYAPESNEKRYERFGKYFNGWDIEYIKTVSPVEIAKKKNNLKFRTILFVGTADITVGPKNAVNFKNALKKAGNKNVEIVTYENVTHSVTKSYCANDMYEKSFHHFSSVLTGK